MRVRRQAIHFAYAKARGINHSSLWREISKETGDFAKPCIRQRLVLMQRHLQVKPLQRLEVALLSSRGFVLYFKFFTGRVVTFKIIIRKDLCGQGRLCISDPPILTSQVLGLKT